MSLLEEIIFNLYESRGQQLKYQIQHVDYRHGEWTLPAKLSLNRIKKITEDPGVTEIRIIDSEDEVILKT